MSNLIDDVDRHLGIKPGRKPAQAKLPGFSNAQLEELEAAIEAYQGAKDRLDAAVAAHKPDLDEATLGLIAVMPMLGHATWHAYRELVDASAWPERTAPRTQGAR